MKVVILFKRLVLGATVATVAVEGEFWLFVLHRLHFIRKA